MNLKTHHVAFSVDSLETSLKWYKENLSFELVHKNKWNDLNIALIKSGEVTIELFQFDEGTDPLPENQNHQMTDLHTTGVKHLCIEVENLDETIKELKEKSVEFATEIDTAGFGGKYIFIKDCNGILIELYQR
mgnify:CR=1 FL=1